MLTLILYTLFFGSAGGLLIFGGWGAVLWRRGEQPAPGLFLPAWICGVIAMSVPAVCGFADSESQACSNLISSLEPVLVTYVFAILGIVAAAAAVGRVASTDAAQALFSLAFWISVIAPLVFLAVVVR